jgi:hypothetical protein
MDFIYVEFENEKQKVKVENFLKKEGIKFSTLDDNMKRYIAGLKMVEIAERHPKFDITDDEIINMLKEDENDIYGQEDKADN